MAGFYHYGKHADAQFHFSLQTTSTILIRWTGLLHQFYRPVNPLRVAIEDPFTFSERLFEVQFFITRRNPGRMFILTTKAVSIRVYDLKHPTIFPSFRKSFFPVSVSTSTEFLYTCSHFDSPSLCKRCHPQLFTPLIIWEFSSKTHSLRVFYSQVMFMSSYWSFYF